MRTLAWAAAAVVLFLIAANLISQRQADDPATASMGSFNLLEAAFEELNRRVESQAGVRFFTDVEDLGDGIVQVTATEAWLSGSQQEQEANVQTLLDMWEAAEGTGLPIAVRVVDQRGEVVMLRNR